MNGVSSAGAVQAGLQQLSDSMGASEAVREELARLLVELVQRDRHVQRALMDLVCSLPNVVTRI